MKLYVDRDSYGGNPNSVLVEAVNNSVRDIVRRHLLQSGIDWSSFVSGIGWPPALSREIAGIEERILTTGYRFSSASFASARDRPDAYRDSKGAPTISIEHADADTGPLDIDGREQRGTGDNVVRHHFNVVGTARYIRTSEQVIEYLRVGVPSDTIAIVEDSGCTLTAPILQNFKGVICAGGTVRSHLGILTREYGVPCLMNARISGIQEGERVELETSARAKTAAAYQNGQDCSARIWRHRSMHAVVDSETLKESPRLTYMQILEANNVIQTCGDETYWLAVTRTVQRSTQFPISACIVFSFLNCFYRYPSILRKIETRLKAEELADRARNLGLKLQSAQMGWLLPAYYLFGREWLLSMGMLRPQDAAQDIVYVLDFWRRFQLAWRRNDGHLTNREYGHRAQILPDRTLEVFAADMHPCASGDALYEAAHQFMATASQYCFLVACESRTNVQNSGPYRLDEGREMLIRDFMDLAECALPWLDGVASDIPYNDLTVTITTQGCHFNIVDDWGSFESVPEFTQEMLTGVGLYTSDALSEGFTPIGMGSADELASVLLDLTSRLKQTMTTLWTRMSGWSRDQLLDAGALTYYAAIKDLAHVAGVFAPEDWLEIDPRAEQFRPLLNDEYAESLIGELVGGISLPGQQSSPFGMMQHADRPARIFSPLPCSLVIDGDYLPSVGELRAGTSHLEAKNDRYRTTRGVMTAAEYNAAAGAHEPAVCSTRFRYLCEAWVKYHRDTPLADELYRLGQGHSRRLKGNGANYTEDSRKAAMASMHRLLHGLALRPNSSVVEVAELIDVHPAEVLSLLEAARGTGRVVEVNERFMLSPLSRIALETSYSREYADVRGNKAFIDDYEAFERINVDLKGLITDWQTTEVGGDRIANNHEDNDYDLAVIDRLGALHDCVDGAIARLGREIPRLNRYRERLLVALKKAEDGEFKWLSDAQIDSYHTVWFQLHEDLLRIVGRRRME